MKQKFKFDFVTIYSIFSLLIALYFLYLTISNYITLSSLDANSLFEGFEGLPKMWIYAGFLFPILFLLYSIYYLVKRSKIGFIKTIILGTILTLMGIFLLTVNVNSNFHYLTIIQDTRFPFILIGMGLLAIIYKVYVRYVLKK